MIEKLPLYRIAQNDQQSADIVQLAIKINEIIEHLNNKETELPKAPKFNSKKFSKQLTKVSKVLQEQNPELFED